MAPLQQYQAGFAVTLMDATLPPVAEIASRSAARLAIHRNNVQASLVAVLEARYPVIARLVGEEFFRAMALVFVSEHPPLSPVLARYGDGFAGFLRDFEPARGLPYLPDMARLEWARHAAYHATDAEPAAIADLAAIPEPALAATRLQLHPAAIVVASDFPIVSLWQTNTHDDQVRAIGADQAGEAALVTRPHLDVLVTPLPASGVAFFKALSEDLTLAAAAETLETTAELPRLLATLFDAGAIARIDS